MKKVYHRLMISVFAIILILGGCGKTPENNNDTKGTNFLSKDNYLQAYSGNRQWFKNNVPFFDFPDETIQKNYYFRWDNYYRNIKSTADGYVITEFNIDVDWAGKNNTIVCAAAHHIYEGRWLHNQQYLNDYQKFWFSGDITIKKDYYNWWAADAYYARYLVNGDTNFVVSQFDNLVTLYNNWYQTSTNHSVTSYNTAMGLYFGKALRDGMEYPVSGIEGFRPTLNSYMYGDARAIAKIAALAGKSDLEKQFNDKAEALKNTIIAKLWNSSDLFFEVKNKSGLFTNVREEIGFVPWYFNIPEVEHSQAWAQLTDPEGFSSPYGIRTCEKRSNYYMGNTDYKGNIIPTTADCLWNGPIWPFATSQTLTALANLLNNYNQSVVNKDTYYNELLRYTDIHNRQGFGNPPTIEENFHPEEGKWIRGYSRSLHYNHSTYNDLIITGLCGLRPRADNTLEVNPLVPSNITNFCLEDVYYHGHYITILWDQDGSKYGQGAGLRLYSDGKLIAESPTLGKLTVDLNAPPLSSPTPLP